MKIKVRIEVDHTTHATVYQYDINKEQLKIIQTILDTFKTNLVI